MINEETYTLGYGAASTAMMQYRTAQGHAVFLLPHLRPGMKVLDCGCGPGSLTLSLAEIVSPGEVVGTDLEESQVEIGRTEAARRQMANVSFRQANIYELPFADDSFDAVVVSAVLGNLREPLRGLLEARRVLRPGGVVALKEFDHAGDLFHPLDHDLQEGLELYHRLRRHNGHDPEGGRKVLGWLQEAGFRDVSVSAVYDTFSNTQALQQIGMLFALLIKEAFAAPSLQLGWATEENVNRTILAWQGFSQKPGAFYAQAWCEGLGWK